MENTRKVQETDEAWLLQIAVAINETKDETIISVIKRLFGEHITSSRLVGKNTEQRTVS